MANPYEIDFQGPSLAPAISLLAAARNQRRQNARADQYLDMERQAMSRNALRQSAEDKRKEEDDKRRQAIEAWTAMPLLQRVAAKSVGMANANPYGVKFNETMQQPDQTQADTAVGGFLGAEQRPQEAPDIKPTVQSLPPGVEGPEQQFPGPDAGTSTDELMNRATIGAPLDALSQAAMTSFAPSTRKLTATYGGQTFDVPEQRDTTGLGPKYDAIYQTMLAIPGITQQHALDKTLADYEKDQAESGRSARLEKTLGFRNTNREDQQKFQREENAKYRNEGMTVQDRKDIANIMARAKMASAGAGPVAPGIAELVAMKESGASDAEIYDRAAQLHLSEKQVTTPVQNVVRNAAAGERAGQKREALTATDERGNVIGTWKDSTAARTGAKQIESFNRVKMRLQELIDDVARTGNRVLTPEEIQQRVSKGESVVAALRPYNELGSTDASVKMEAAIVGALGAPGHGFLMGANPTILQRLLHEAENQHAAQLATKLRPGGGSHLAPALGGPKRQSQGGGQLDAAKKWLTDNPGADPELRAKVQAKIQAMEAGGG